MDEAEKLYKKAEKSLETGFLKWSKDYTSAAIYYD